MEAPQLLSRLHRCCNVLHQLASTDEIYKTAVVMLAELAGVPYTELWLSYEETGVARLAAVNDETYLFEDFPSFLPLDQSVIGEIITTGTFKIHSDLREMRHWRRREWSENKGLTRYIGAPLVFEGQVVGAFSILAEDSHQLDVAERQIIEFLADQTAVAIQRKRAEEELRLHTRQQAVAAEVGSLALLGGELQDLLDKTVRLTAEGLGVEMCKILKLEESGERLRLVAGVGWRGGLVGKATVGTGLESQAGYTLLEGGPVIVEDLRSEERFSRPLLLQDHGVVSGVSVPMVAAPDFVFGIMGVHTTQRREFSEDDTHFLETVANVVTTAIMRKRAEEELREANEELRRHIEFIEQAQEQLIRTEKMTSVGLLTAGVTHEILNPLSVITMSFHMMLDNPNIPQEIAEDLRVMQEQANRIIKISQNLLYFARKREPERKETNLNEIINKTLSLLEHELRLGNIAVELRLAEDLPKITADQDQLQQTVLNLLNNARDVMEGGGRLVLSTREVQSLFSAQASVVEFRVEDTGPGIAPEQLNRLFDPFFTTKPEGKGTGLGLSICQGIIESHGGSIWAENVPGGGAAFIVRMRVGEG